MSTQLNKWTLANGAVKDTTTYRSPSSSTDHPVVNGPATLGTQTSEDVGMSSGLPHTVTAWVYRAAAATDVDLNAYHYPDDVGTRVLVTSFDEGDLTTDTWTEVSFSVTPNRGANTIEFEALSGPTLQSGNIWVDDVEFSIVAASLTRRMRDALLADLARVTRANGFRRELQTVAPEPSVLSEVRGPAAFLFDGSYLDTEPETTCGRHAIHHFQVLAFVSHKDGIETIDDLVDDIRNAIEPSDSTLNGLSEVNSVGVTAVQEPVTEEDVSEDAHVRVLTVAVDYSYTEGSL